MIITTRQGGFSLIEILVALAILVIGMVGVIATFSSAVSLHQQGIDQTSAALVAETVLERMQAEALAGKSADELSTGSAGAYQFVSSERYPAYQKRIVCEELNDQEFLLTVDVRLRPRHRAADDAETLTFRTILIRP